MTIEEEGRRITEELGVAYTGPQMYEGEFMFHLFTDPVTGTTFAAKTLEEARAKLSERRKAFGK